MAPSWNEPSKSTVGPSSAKWQPRGVSRRDALLALAAAGLGWFGIRRPRSARIAPRRSHGSKPPFGIALEYEPMTSEADYRALVTQVARCVAVAGPFFWEFTEPEPGVFRFDEPDEMLAFAAAHGLPAHAHNLVWHRALPAWAERFSDASSASAALERHVSKVASHFRGRVKYWNVVNEAVEPTGESDLRQTVWYRMLGESYIDTAFRVAREADPTSSLGLSDFDLENDSSYAARKRSAFLSLVRRLRQRGVPIDHVGLQSHLTVADRYSAAGLGRFLEELTSLGVIVCITELDVDDAKVAGSDSARDRAVADTYARYLDIALAHANVGEVITWGVTDRHTWLTWKSPRSDGRPPRPLPFDSQLRPTEAWNVLVDRLSVRGSPK